MILLELLELNATLGDIKITGNNINPELRNKIMRWKIFMSDINDSFTKNRERILTELQNLDNDNIKKDQYAQLITPLLNDDVKTSHIKGLSYAEIEDLIAGADINVRQLELIYKNMQNDGSNT